MQFNISRIAILLITALLFTACDKDKNEDEPKTPQRTVLVYIAAHNTLGSGSVKYDYRDINEMVTAVQTNNLEDANIIVYHAPYNETPSLKLITADGAEEIKQYDPTPYSVTVDRMKEVFADMRAIAPAEKYGLILWSHASGWMFSDNASPELSRSWGIDRGKEMSIPKLAEALQGEGFDYIYFDCCLMGNIETLYELRGCADYIVASPTETPLDGMPYNENIPLLTRSVPDLVGAAANTYNFYNNQSNQSSRSIAISVYDMSKIDQLASVMRSIYSINMTMPAGFSPQTYYWSMGSSLNRKFYDLYHYSTALIGENDGSLTAALNRAMDDFVIYKANTESMWATLPLTNCHGLSTFIYSDGNADSDRYNYRDLRWYQDVIPQAANE